ncbi:MAG: hypothetical protein JSW59_06840 [Phycisphaerales bacterium]|nr:MAG: hypothetical protein JSW59_06840 [Phycisphaerales bacterium]
MRSRIAAAAAVGVLIIGVLAWPLAAPGSPFEAVRAGSMGYTGAVALVFAAFLTGLIGYFVSWPYGQEIGILAVPSGLAVWAVRSGSMGGLMQMNLAVTQRQALYATMRWEPVFWLVIVAAGFSGVLLGRRIRPAPGSAEGPAKRESGLTVQLRAIIGLIASVVIAQSCVRIFTRNVELYNSELGSVVSQPAIGQIVFGVVLSFGVAAFVAKTLLGVGYIWSILASGLITPVAAAVHAKESVLQVLSAQLPAICFPDTVLSILPLQMVAFGTLGSVGGYWMGVKYVYWRKHDSE